jgi:hypothetical protein
MQQVKQLQAKFPGSTVNDILASVLTLTIKRYYEDKNDPVLEPGRRSLVRSSFPLSIRPPSACSSGKKAGAMSVDNIFAMGEFVFDFKASTGSELVWGVKEQVDRIKASPQVWS